MPSDEIERLARILCGKRDPDKIVWGKRYADWQTPTAKALLMEPELATEAGRRALARLRQERGDATDAE